MGRLHREIMPALIEDIVAGRRAAGELLPREVDLAAAFAVSRGVARECLRAMEERGLVSVRHGRGATVRPSEDWDVFDPDILGGDAARRRRQRPARGVRRVPARDRGRRRRPRRRARDAGAPRAAPRTALARMEESAGRAGRGRRRSASTRPTSRSTRR